MRLLQNYIPGSSCFAANIGKITKCLLRFKKLHYGLQQPRIAQKNVFHIFDKVARDRKNIENTKNNKCLLKNGQKTKKHLKLF